MDRWESLHLVSNVGRSTDREAQTQHHAGRLGDETDQVEGRGRLIRRTVERGPGQPYLLNFPSCTVGVLTIQTVISGEESCALQKPILSFLTSQRFCCPTEDTALFGLSLDSKINPRFPPTLGPFAFSKKTTVIASVCFSASPVYEFHI